jgi:hypothetical protein
MIAEELVLFMAVKLTSDAPVYNWDPEKVKSIRLRISGDKLNPYTKPKHALALKQVILGKDAKPGEVNLVELKTKGADDETIEVPLAYLTHGTDYQKEVNLILHAESTVELKLVQGTGPLYVLANHVVSAPNFEELDDEEAEEAEEGDDGDVEMDAEDTGTKVNGVVKNGDTAIANEKKRKTDDSVNGDLKKVKMVEGVEVAVEVRAEDNPVAAVDEKAAE